MPWSPDADLPSHLLPAVDVAIDALGQERTAGRQRWLDALEADDRSLRRAQLVLRGAATGWLPAEQARAALVTERQPLVRLALFTLFLPETIPGGVSIAEGRAGALGVADPSSHDPESG